MYLAAVDVSAHAYRVVQGTHCEVGFHPRSDGIPHDPPRECILDGAKIELAVLFERLGINTPDVLAAAGTKWNFLPFTPGLVGGHCIGVGPYYSTHKAQAVGHHPEIILAGRRLNDSMGAYVASRMVKEMTKNGAHIQGARVLMLGLTFKENTPDLRNTRVIDVVRELEDYGILVDVFDLKFALPEGVADLTL